MDTVAQAQAVEDRQNHQRGQALCGRRHVVQRGPGHAYIQRRHAAGAVRLQISQAQRSAQPRMLGGNGFGDASPVVIIQPLVGQGLERARQRRIAAQRVDQRHLPRCAGRCRRIQKLSRKSGNVGQLGQKLGSEIHLTLGHRRALAGVPDRVLQQARCGQLAAQAFAVAQRFLPAGDGSGYRVGGQWAAPGNGWVAGVKVQGRRTGGAAAGVNRHGSLARLGDKPEAVTANGVHVRVDHGNRGGCGHHGLDGIAPLAQNGAGATGSEVVGRGHHAARRCQSLAHGGLSVFQKLLGDGFERNVDFRCWRKPLPPKSPSGAWLHVHVLIRTNIAASRDWRFNNQP